ncbi:MAG: phosphoglycerate kinase [Chromatiaceae bacterium]|nr:phosphoglycerate kinase [Chromatiaceae bacterium]
MGLDMYAMVTTESLPGAVDFRTDEATELYYWRKHPNLHGWMQELYYQKGGKADSFNCEPVVLTGHDLDRLEADVKNGALPDTTGFFFGVSDGREAEDLEFIARARQALSEGKTVFYDSWW